MTRLRRLTSRYLFWAAVLFIGTVSCASQASAEVKAIQTLTTSKPAVAKAAAKTETKKDPTLKSVEKSLNGKIVFIRKTKMSVLFGSNEQDGDLEMFLNLDKGVKLKGAKDLSKLQYGDEIKVKYTEIYRESKEKTAANVIVDRVVTEIQFVKAAPKMQTVQSDAIVGGEGL